MTTAAADVAVTQTGFSETEWQLVRRLAAQSVHPVSRAIAGSLTTGDALDRLDAPLLALAAILYTRHPATNCIFDEQEALLANPYVNGKAGGWLANRLRQPAVLGELLAGLLLGPSLLNMLDWPALTNPSNPHLLSETVFELAELGVICSPTFWITCLMSRALRRIRCSHGNTPPVS